MELLFLWLLGISAVRADYYFADDLCGKSTILLKNCENSCVCFNNGSYELNACDGKGPLFFDTIHDICVIVPYITLAITRKEVVLKSTIKLRACKFQTAYVSRPKRSTADPLDDQTYDEDHAGYGVEIGSEVMRDQISRYMGWKLSKLTGLHGEDGGTGGYASRSKYPVIKLLEYTKHIMAKTCSFVSEDFLDLALNVFVNLQLEAYQIKEPFLGYSAYTRIQMALERCLSKAERHVFYNNDSKMTANDEFCKKHTPDEVTDRILTDVGKPTEEMILIKMPPYARFAINDTTITEPLIETVWKMLINAHSYCYIYFSDYFNDHHTFTVALLPLFTNKIQDVWLQGYSLGDAFPDNVLYGGLLGDINRVMNNIDYCTGASKEASPYPWIINRPPRDKSNVWRKKRATASVKNLEGETDVNETFLQFQCLPENVNICSMIK